MGNRELYEQLIREGVVRGLQGEMLRCLSLASEPMTVSEMADFLWINQRNTLSPRAAEMERMGLIERTGQRKCNITGRPAYTFQMRHGEIKPQIGRRKSELEILRGEVKQLKGVIAQLRAMLTAQPIDGQISLIAA